MSNEKIDNAINTLSKDNDIIELINRIENGIKTTKDNYGKYLQFLSQYSKEKTLLYVISEALKLAGANVNGVNSAIIILIG